MPSFARTVPTDQLDTFATAREGDLFKLIDLSRTARPPNVELLASKRLGDMGDVSKRPPVLGGTLFLGQSSGPLPPYTPQGIVGPAIELGSYTGAAGVVVAAAQNALTEHTAGARGVVTRYGGTIAVAAGMGVAFATMKNVVSNFRQREDGLETAAGACAAGFLTGVRSGSIPAASANCVIFGTAGAVWGLTGGIAKGPSMRPTWEAREALREEMMQKARDPMLDKL